VPLNHTLQSTNVCILLHCIAAKSAAWLISCSNEKRTFIVELVNAGSVCLRLFLSILQKKTDS